MKRIITRIREERSEGRQGMDELEEVDCCQTVKLSKQCVHVFICLCVCVFVCLCFYVC